MDGLANVVVAVENMDEMSLHVEECGGLNRVECRATTKSMTIGWPFLKKSFVSTTISMITTTVQIQSVCADNFNHS